MTTFNIPITSRKHITVSQHITQSIGPVVADQPIDGPFNRLLAINHNAKKSTFLVIWGSEGW